MAATFKPTFDLSEATRVKSFGILAICLYISVLLILMFSIGYFTLKSSEDNLPYIFPCSFRSDPAVNLQEGWSHFRFCPPAYNIFFLKTHKCASSTVQNILMRYGDERNLSFILPKDSNYIGHPEHFSRKMIPKKLSHFSYFNILCHHLRFHAQSVQEVMPQSTIYISILRNPVSLFRSMYDYYNMTNISNKTIEDFMQDPKSLEDLSSNRFYNKLGRNQMLFDFGFDSNTWENESRIFKAIDEIDQTFHLVMIQELFDESLILLKHKLCWSMSDIVYLKHNMRTEKTNTRQNNISNKIEEYNAADKLLYDYFFNKLNTIIDTFGRERMANEVRDLRLWNNVWYNNCVKKMANLSENVPAETKASSSKVYSFILKDEPIAEICKQLAMEELQYTEKLRKKR